LDPQQVLHTVQQLLLQQAWTLIEWPVVPVVIAKAAAMAITKFNI